jgi:hypothetical protein
VVFAVITDWERIGLDDDGDIWLALFVHKINVNDDAETVFNFVWNIFQQPLGICEFDDVATVTFTDFKNASLGIGVAANPFEPLIAPVTLPFDYCVSSDINTLP